MPASGDLARPGPATTRGTDPLTLDTALSAEEHAAWVASTERVQAVAAGALRGASTAAEALQWVVHLHTGVDRATASAAARGVPIACREGCSHCCHAPVMATEAEVLRIVEHVADQGPDAVERVRAALAARASSLPASQGAHPQAAATAWSDRPPCVLLVDQRCSVYDVRPAACRKAHSLDRAACAASAPRIPQDLALLLDAEALMQGVNAAWGDAGWPAPARPLPDLLAESLADPDSARDRWWAGRRTADPALPRG
jgi:uncharacterized protein